MARRMNIAADCAECSTCPTPTVEWDSRSASKTKCGFCEFAPGGVLNCASGVRYLVATYSGRESASSNCYSGHSEYLSSDCSFFGDGQRDVFCNGSLVFSWTSAGPYPVYNSPTRTSATNDGGANYAFIDLSNQYTTALLRTNTVAAIPAYDEDWDDNAGSFANLSTDELSYAIRESRYRLRFQLPRVRTGRLYRVSWAERLILEAGAGIDSVEVYSPGVYRPTVTLSAPPAGGTQARAMAVMSSTGTVTSIRILNPGGGYASAPTVTVQAASSGGTSSTGWVATLSTTGGQVATIASGTGGNYLPTLSFSGGAGAGATATVEMDDQGGISAVTVGAPGSGYTSAPTLTITSKVTGSTSADLLLHLGTETARCAAWDGSTLAGRWFLRAVAAAGHAISSIEVVYGGNYLPTVTITGGGGTGATAVVSGFSSDGKVTAITVMNGGSGYTSAPIVTITGRNGGSGATATAAVSGGTVTGITVGAQGNYRPTLTISGGGGTGAAATVDLATTGEISAVNLTAPGSGYKTNPTLTLSYYGTETILLAAHFGTETEFADGAEPPGALPVGYVDGVIRTYPLIGDTGTAPWRYFEVPVPTVDGTLLAANVRAVCDGTPCP